jgi:hypothetical protein
MGRYAMDEIQNLAKSLPSPIDDRSATVRYLCAIFSELAYYHIPQWEIDDRKRAKLIPCEGYRKAVTRGIRIDLMTVIQELDLPRGFVAIDRGVIAVGIVLNRLLFIGFRGTQFLFDWRVNLRANMVPVSTSFRRGPFAVGGIFGRLHSGFAEEAMRISSRISDAVRDSNLGDFDHVFLTGHSLGGAVAAIAENFIRFGPTSVCVLGSPRYGDASSYFNLPMGPPTQVRRPGDIVPTTPPRFLGYSDHLYEFTTGGTPYFDPPPLFSQLGGIGRWARFLMGRFEPHSVEAYRKDLGVTAGAYGASDPLVAEAKLTRMQAMASP